MRALTTRCVAWWAQTLAACRDVVVRARDLLVARGLPRTRADLVAGLGGLVARLVAGLVAALREPRRTAATLVARRHDAARTGVVVALVTTIAVSSVGFVTGDTQRHSAGLLAARQAQEQDRADQTRAEEVAAAREAAATSAQVAIDKAEAVRDVAAQAAVPDETLASLDEAAAQVQDLLAQVREAPVSDPGATQVRAAAPDASTAQGPAQSATADPDASSTLADPIPIDLPVTTPQTLPDPDADSAVILDAVPTVVDEVKETLPEVTVDDDALTQLLAAVDQLAESTAEVNAAAEANLVTAELQTTYEQAVADAAAAQAAAQAAAIQSRAARLRADARSLDGYSNGQIPTSALCAPAFSLSSRLRCDAAEMLDGLNQAYRARFGTSLVVTDSYRTLAGQITCRETKGYMCADPGTSKHGLGLAVDLGGPAGQLGTVEHQWMLDHVAEYGWNKPNWSLPTGSKPESWHWEFVGVP